MFEKKLMWIQTLEEKRDIPVPVQWGPQGHGGALSDGIIQAGQRGERSGEKKKKKTGAGQTRQIKLGKKQEACVCVQVVGNEGAENVY